MFTDIDEWNYDNHVCDANANCTNTNGSHYCICKEGYIIIGQSCQCRLDKRTLCREKQLSIASIVFVTRLMMKRQRNDFHAPTSYFY